jgi:hypothetical protein
MSKLIESVTVIYVDAFKLRIWRQEAEDFKWEQDWNNDLFVKAHSLKGETMSNIAKALSDMEGVNAVEVADTVGHAIVVYNDWP